MGQKNQKKYKKMITRIKNQQKSVGLQSTIVYMIGGLEGAGSALLPLLCIPTSYRSYSMKRSVIEDQSFYSFLHNKETQLINRFINFLTKKGQKAKAAKLFYESLKIVLDIEKSRSLLDIEKSRSLNRFEEAGYEVVASLCSEVSFPLGPCNHRQLIQQKQKLSSSIRSSEILGNPEGQSRNFQSLEAEPQVESKRSGRSLELLRNPEGQTRNFQSLEAEPQVFKIFHDKRSGRSPHEGESSLELLRNGVFDHELLGYRVAEPQVFKIFHEAISNIKPFFEVKKVRIAGTTYQVPTFISQNRQEFIAMNWLIESTTLRKKKDSSLNFSNCLAQEINDCYMKQGYCRQKRTELHKVAENNRAFSHFRWW
jgi:ribosomal protein S7